MKLFLKNNWLFLFLYVLILAYSSFYLLNFEKAALHLKINTLVGVPFFDSFFKYITYLGDGIFAALIAFVFLFFNIKKGIFILLSYIASGLTSAYLKNHVFDINRPHFVFTYFIKNTQIKYIDGIDMISLNSFPSGHATTSFAVFISLALLSKSQFNKICCLALAVLGAFSRVYLSQHWLIDVTIGSLIGLGFSLLMYIFIMRENCFPKINKPLFKFK